MAKCQHTNVEWRQISHDTNYLISNYGEVRNIKRNRTLSPFTGSGGYHRVDLPSGRYYIHKLVAEAFICPAPEGHVATHQDRDVTHNCAENILWSTKSDIARAAWLRNQTGMGEFTFPTEGVGVNG